MLPASEKSRNESTSGKPGSEVALLNDDVPSAAKNSGKMSEGMTSAG